MVVAAGAGDSEAKDAARDGVDALVPIVGEEGVDDVQREALILVIDRGRAQVAERA